MLSEEGCVYVFCCFVVPRGQCIYYTYEERVMDDVTCDL